MSVNYFPYIPIVTNPENNPNIQTVTRIATEIWSFVHWPIANLPWKFHANPFGSFCAKLLADKQANTDENISSLVEVLNQYACTVHKTRTDVSMHVGRHTYRIKADIKQVQALADISRSRNVEIASQTVHRFQIYPTVHN